MNTNDSKDASSSVLKLYSLRLRLLYSIIGISVFFWIISVSIMVYTAWEETNEMFDDVLKTSAKMLLQATNQQTEFVPYYADKERKLDPDDFHYQIIRHGEVVSRTKHAPITPFVADVTDRKSFHDLMLDGKKWRVYTILSKHNSGFQIQVGQAEEMRLDILEELAEDLIIPAIIILLILAGLSTFTIYYLLNPLTVLANQLEETSPNELAPLETSGHSKEMTAIVIALNTLLERLHDTLENERRFTADAAHELRTPLAALSMQAQLLQRKHPNMREGLGRLRRDIDRSTQLIKHLLLLARLDPMDEKSYRALGVKSIKINELYQEIYTLFIEQAKNSSISIHYDDKPILVKGSQELLRILIQNLVKNALLYCPEGSDVYLEAEDGDTHTLLTIRDTGNGIADNELQRLTDRFYRILGTEKSGSGLGLSIVKRIIELHNGQLVVESGSRYQGLKYKIYLPK